MSKESHNPIVVAANREIAENSGVLGLMQQIRPEWKGKKLIERVERLITVDPSSACQRIFNAAVHDIKKKVLIAGIDIAKEAAQVNRLPAINRAEDIEEYNVSKTIDLAYYMGILSRPEWRRLTRVYDIRRDLEHEDDEYEATLEDCFYIFKTSIEAVLSRDPVEVLRLTDIKDIVEQPNPITLDQTVRDEYEAAPAVRQAEIYKFLISSALDQKHPDVVRHNCYIALGVLSTLTIEKVKIEVSTIYADKVKRKGLDVFTARVAYCAGILPYFKKSILRDFYESYLDHMKAVGYDFRQNAKHGTLLREFQEIGGLAHCHDESLSGIIEWLCLCYIGERSFGRYSASRKVFYSNTGAPLSFEILVQSKDRIEHIVHDVIKNSREIKNECSWPSCQRRAQQILDAISP